MATKYLNNPKSTPKEQPGVPIAFSIVFSLVKVEANKTDKKTGGTETHAKLNINMKSMSGNKSETG